MRFSKFKVTLAVVFSALCSLNAGLQKDDLVAIVGDSITGQCIYSRYMEEYLLMCQPVKDVEAMQFGWGGEFARALLGRLEHDILSFKPEVVTLMYGMNDGRYKPTSEELLSIYRESMTTVVQKLKAAGTREIYLASPGVVDPAYFSKATVSADDYNVALKTIGEEARAIASAEGIHFVDLHTVMANGVAAAKEAYGKEYQIAPDGIHPRTNGHLLIATAFLEAMGCDGQIGRIEIDFADQQATADANQEVLVYDDGELQLLSSRYPFFLENDGSDLDAETMGSLVGFNEALNRYTLIVKNAPEQLKVQWGNASRVYAKESLEAGVNLAADFPDNPFKEPFMAVSQEIRNQQQFERTAIRYLLNSVPKWEQTFKASHPELGDDLREVVFAESAAQREVSQQAVQPVAHTIILQPVH